MVRGKNGRKMEVNPLSWGDGNPSFKRLPTRKQDASDWEVEVKLIGEKLRASRLSTGKSRYAVSKETGLSYTSMYEWEKGSREPNVQNLKRLSRHYGVSLNWLIHGIGPRLLQGTAVEANSYEVYDEDMDKVDDEEMPSDAAEL